MFYRVPIGHRLTTVFNHSSYAFMKHLDRISARRSHHYRLIAMSLAAVGCLIGTEAAVSGTVVGTVLDRATGQPLANVRIEYGSVSLRTRSDGTYEIRDLPTGRHSLRFALDGYETEDIVTSVVRPEDRLRLDATLARQNGPTTSIRFDALPSLSVRRPDAEADPVGGGMIGTERLAPTEKSFSARVDVGYNSTLIGQKALDFSTDSIQADPIERFGSDYRAAPDDFPRENLRLTTTTALPDVTATLDLGTRVAESRLGLRFSGSLESRHRRLEGYRNYEYLDQNNHVYFLHREQSTTSIMDRKIELVAAGDFTLEERDRISASVAFGHDYATEARRLTDTNRSSSPVLSTKERTQTEEHRYLNARLEGLHRFGNIGIQWLGGWGVSDDRTPDRAELRTASALLEDGGRSPDVFKNVSRDWQYGNRSDGLLSIDLDWTAGTDGETSVKAGGLVRGNSADNRMNAYLLLPVPDTTTGQVPLYTGLDDLEWEVANVSGTPEYSNNNYEASETILAGYLQGSTSFGRLNVLGGIRVEGTTAEYSTQDVNVQATITATKSYMDLLPSLHLGYALNADSRLLLSAGRSVRRPNYVDLVPYTYVGGEFRRRGNPDLRHSVVTEIDLRYELAPASTDWWECFINPHAEWIRDPVEIALDVSNRSLPTLIPKNLGTATGYGCSIGGEVRVGSTLSLSGAYTFDKSEVSTDKIRFNSGAGATEIVQESHSLEGRPGHRASLALNLADTAAGTRVRFDLDYVGRHVARVSHFIGLDHLRTGSALLNVHAAQELFGGFSAYFTGENLLAAPYEIRLENGMTLEWKELGARYEIGVEYRM